MREIDQEELAAKSVCEPAIALDINIGGSQR